MARKQPFHAISVRQHAVVVLFFCSYLRTYALRPTHPEFNKTHIIRERSGILNHYKFTIVNRAARATQKHLWVSGGSSVASLNAIFCSLVHHSLIRFTQTQTYTVSSGIIPTELASRGAPYRRHTPFTQSIHHTSTCAFQSSFLKSRQYSCLANHSDVPVVVFVQQYSCTNASSTTYIRRQTFDALLSAGLRLQILTFVSSAG